MHPDTYCLADLPEVSDLLLKLGKVRLHIASRSMVPALEPGDEVSVEPVPGESLRSGDLVLFKHQGRLICHRVVELSAATLLTRGDAATSAGERIGLDQVLGKVVEIRKRTLWVGLRERLRTLSVASLHRCLPRLQQPRAYRFFLRPLVVPAISYHVGLAEGLRWYDWQELRGDGRFPRLPRSRRPHLLVAKRGKGLVGWCALVIEGSRWQPENPHVRTRYRGLGLESDLGRMARRLAEAQ